MGELILWTGKGMVLEVIDGHWSMVGEGEFDAKVVYLKDEEKYQILCNAVEGGILLDRISPELKHEKARKGFVQWIDGKKAYGLKIRDDGKADALVKVIESAKKREHVMKKGANNSFFGSLSRKNSRGSASPGTPGSAKGVSGDVFAFLEEVRREGIEQREVLRNELAEVRAALARMEGKPSPAPTSSFFRPQEASPQPTILSAPVKTAPAGPPPAGPPAPPATRGPPPPPAPAMGGPPPPPPPAAGGGPPPPPPPASGGGPPPPPPPPSGQAAPSSGGGGMSLAEQLAAKKAGGLKSSASPAPKASAPPKMDMMEQIRNRKKNKNTTQPKMAPPPASAPPTKPPAGGPPPPPPSGSGPPPPPPGGPGGGGPPPPPPPPPAGLPAPTAGKKMTLAEQLAAKKATMNTGAAAEDKPAPKKSAPPPMDMMEQIRARKRN